MADDVLSEKEFRWWLNQSWIAGGVGEFGHNSLRALVKSHAALESDLATSEAARERAEGALRFFHNDVSAALDHLYNAKTLLESAEENQ